MRRALSPRPLTIVSVEDRVLRQETSQHFWHAMTRLASSPGPHAVFLNLSRVEYITASGLGSLVALRNRLADAGGELGLLNVSPWTYEILRLTRLTTLMTVRPKEAIRPRWQPTLKVSLW